MVNIVDCSVQEFKKRINNKKVVLFGAGTRAQMFYDYFELEDKVKIIIDNNENLRGTTWNNSEKVSIIHLYDFIELTRDKNNTSIVILVTPMFFAYDIIQQLNGYEELNGIECYVGSMLITHYTNKKFSFTTGKAKIPKKIHYCWFGKSNIPAKLQEYMKSWKIYCPDYEIIRWDEHNYDVSKNGYMYSAYQNQKWGFVPDYARLDIIYNEGGIYLDTDVELISNLDKLLNDEMFCGVVSDLGIAMGLGFGAVKNNNLIGECLEVYNSVSFYKDDGSLNLCPCAKYQNSVLKKNGFKIINDYQNINGHVVYPSEVLSPTMHGESSIFTEKTVSIHHNANSWLSENEKKGWEKLKNYIRENHNFN